MHKPLWAHGLAPGADGAATSWGSGGWGSSLLGHCSCFHMEQTWWPAPTLQGLGHGSPMSPASTRLLWASFSCAENQFPFSKASLGKRLQSEGRFVVKWGKASARLVSSHLIILSHPTPSHPIAPHIPSHPTLSHPTLSHPTPSHLILPYPIPISSGHPCQSSPDGAPLASGAGPLVVEATWSVSLSRMYVSENRNPISKIRRRFIMEFVNFRKELYSQILQTTQGEVILSKTLEIF